MDYPLSMERLIHRQWISQIYFILKKLHLSTETNYPFTFGLSIETFSFSIDEDEIHSASCIFGKKDGGIAGPIEYWTIDENGVLLVYPDENKPSKDCIKLQKREIDAENGIAYLLRNGKDEVYFYRRTESVLIKN